MAVLSGTLLWKAKIGSNGTWTNMKTPSSYKIDWEDLDVNSYRSTINGNLIRHPLTKHWWKIQFNYNYITARDLKTVVEKINQDNLYICAKTPAFGTDNEVIMQGYVSKITSEMLEGQLGYTLSFNFIQSKAVSGQ